MKRKMFVILAANAVMALAAAAATAQMAKPGAISDDVVRIGVLTDMSGTFADIGGLGSVEAARMAVSDFGGKVLGKPIDVVGFDHQNKADIGANKAREWYDTQGVDMITDGLNSGVAIAVAKVSDQKRRAFINVGAASTRLTNEDCTPYMIHYAYDTYALANGTANAIVKQGGKSWFFLTSDYTFGHSLEQETSAVVKSAGGTVIGAVRHPFNAPDFASFMLQAKASKAQIIGLANSGNDAVNAIKAAHEFGVTPDQSLAGLLVLISDVHGLGLAVAQGMYLTDGWYWDYSPETRAFSRRYFEKIKKMPNMIHAGVYSATLTYLKAIQATGTDNAEAVIAQMKKMKINDMFAKNGYVRADGRMMHDMYLMQVKKPGESKYPWDYYQIKATIPAEQAFQPLSLSRCPMIKK
jgi:branched-chain amino acid transport system substrate-binding protein